MEIVRLPLAELEQNIGQIPDLPMNPREWTQTDIDSLARSIKETPELFEARPCLVVPYGGKYVILAGNLRYDAARQNGETEVPAIVFPAETPIEKMKEIVIKDNGSWGKWSMDALANEWYDLPLGEWGAPEWKGKDQDETPTGGGALPAELDGLDLTPEEQEKITGNDNVAYERIVIIYTEEEREKVEALFGVKGITEKVVYTLDEILERQEAAQDGE